MKKNLLSILILVLLIVNIALTAVMMINVTGTNKKTAELITSIATVMNLELYTPAGNSVTEISLTDTDIYDVEQIMVPLAASKVVNEDGTVTTSTKQNYFIFDMSLLQNKTHDDYATLGGAENMSARKSLIMDTVTQVVGSHTLEECQTDLDSIRAELLTEIQKLFGSTFIYKIGLSGFKFG